MEKKLVPISKTAEILGITETTLRRWDKNGSFPAIKSPGGHRYYTNMQIELYRNDLFTLARNWTLSHEASLPPADFYCSNQAVFQSRLMKLEKLLSAQEEEIPWFSLIVAGAGEIGNNSFDHNIGNWPTVPGIFFAFDLRKKEVVLADRGRGILATLKRVRPALNTDEEALHTAFTEIISGRAPEARGNGLKYVKLITESKPISLIFQSGNAEVILEPGKEMTIVRIEDSVPGCLVRLRY